MISKVGKEGAKVACTHRSCTLYIFAQEQTGASGDKAFTGTKCPYPSPSVAQQAEVLFVYMSFTISVPNIPGAPIMRQRKQVCSLLFDQCSLQKTTENQNLRCKLTSACLNTDCR